jgi:hypothetical protein
MNMSSLQIGLAVAGGLVLVAVLIHGAWTSRKNQPRQAEPDAPRVEPQGGDGPVDDAQALASLSLSLPLPGVEKKLPLDPLIDVIAPIALEAPVSGDAVLGVLPSTRRVGSKPFAIEGLNEQSGEWEMPLPGQRYSELQAGVQLANRSGALNEIEYSEFVVKAQAFADAVNGMPEFPEMHDEVIRARELDQFASTHDAQLGVTLRARDSAWSPGYVQQSAARLGFVAGALPGRLVLPVSVPGLPPALVLTFDPQAALADDPAHSAIREVALTLDVAQVDRHEHAFARMRDAAVGLAEAMEGVLTDDNGQLLSGVAMDQIGIELEKLYDILDSRELSAGSPQARRLFS